MANNQLITTQLVANTALAEFEMNAPFLQTSSRMYQKEFTQSGYKIGDTVNLRLQNNFIVGDGSVAVEQGIIETVEPLVVQHQYHVMINYTIQDLVLRIQDFNMMFIRPAIQNIIAQFEFGLAKQAEIQLYNYTGVPGTPINSFGAVDAAGVRLMKQGVNINESYVALNLDDSSKLKQGVSQQFLPMFNEEIVRESRLGHLSYFDIFQSQNIAYHTAGAGPVSHPGDTLTVNGAVSSGNTLVLAGATASIANYFLPGDLITIAGATTMGRPNNQPTNQNVQFIITQAASSSSGGAITLAINPTIISDTQNPLRNVSNPIPNGAVVSVVGSHNVNVAYPMRGVDVVCPPLYKLNVQSCAQATDKRTGISVTITEQGDIKTYQNKMRLDILCGSTWHPQYCAQLIS